MESTRHSDCQPGVHSWGSLGGCTSRAPPPEVLSGASGHHVDLQQAGDSVHAVEDAEQSEVNSLFSSAFIKHQVLLNVVPGPGRMRMSYIHSCPCRVLSLLGGTIR